MNLTRLIAEDFRTVKKNDPAYRSCIELFFNYPGLWALFFHRIAHALHERSIRIIPRVVSGISRALTAVDIHPGAKLGRRVFIDHGVGVVIGETAVVGNDVLIYQQVTLGGVTLERGKRHPTIEDSVVIGAGAKVLGDITIGKEAKIGANSVVISDVAPDCTAVGVPAHVGKRMDDKIPLQHNIMPDFNRDIFDYLIRRIAVLEGAIKSGNIDDMDKKDSELEKIYENFLDSMESS